MVRNTQSVAHQVNTCGLTLACVLENKPSKAARDGRSRRLRVDPESNIFLLAERFHLLNRIAIDTFQITLQVREKTLCVNISNQIPMKGTQRFWPQNHDHHHAQTLFTVLNLNLVMNLWVLLSSSPLFVCFVFSTPAGFTTVMANEGLENPYKKNPCCQWGWNLGTLGVQSSILTTWPPSNPLHFVVLAVYDVT